MTRFKFRRHADPSTGDTAPLANEPRKGLLAFGLHLYQSDRKFRDLIDFAVIGAIVFAFLHPPGLPNLSVLRSLLPGDQQTQLRQEDFTLGKMLDQRRPDGLSAPKPTDLEIDRSLFADSAPQTQERLAAAADAYRHKNPVLTLELLNEADQNDRNVAMVRGIATLALPGPRNIEAGRSLLERAAELDQRQAQTFLGILLVQGPVGVRRDQDRGRTLLEQAAAVGDVDAARFLGLAYHTGWVGVIDNALAVKYLRIAVAAGDPDATLGLAYYAHQGIGMAQDEDLAVRLVHQAGESGFRDAQEVLGMFYAVQFAAGWMPEPSAAVRWLSRAAEAGAPEAMKWLAQIHLELAKEPPWRDKARGAAYFRRCAALWHGPCLFGYATALQLGEGVERDLVKSYALYAVSLEYGQVKAKKRLAEIAGILTSTQITAARRLARGALGKQPTALARLLSPTGQPVRLSTHEVDQANEFDILAEVLAPAEVEELRRFAATAAVTKPVERIWYGEPSKQDRTLYQEAADLIDNRELEQAITLLTDLAAAGEANAQYLLATAYVYNQAIDNYRSISVSWLEKAAHQGHGAAAFHFAAYMNFAAEDPAAALEWYRKALTKGYARAGTALGDMYLAGRGARQDPEKAAEYYALGAEFGDVEASTRLGMLYFDGNLGHRGMVEARTWMEQAARAGDSEAQFNLALWFADGRLGPANTDKYFEWVSRAAEHGHAGAMHHLGEYYRTGADGTKEPDPGHAFQWFRAAAIWNHAESQFRYAELHEQGAGVSQDIVKAFVFYRLSLNQGHPRAGTAVRRLFPRLTCDEFKSALRTEEAWRQVTMPSQGVAVHVIQPDVNSLSCGAGGSALDTSAANWGRPVIQQFKEVEEQLQNLTE